MGQGNQEGSGKPGGGQGNQEGSGKPGGSQRNQEGVRETRCWSGKQDGGHGDQEEVRETRREPGKPGGGQGNKVLVGGCYLEKNDNLFILNKYSTNMGAVRLQVLQSMV